MKRFLLSLALCTVACGGYAQSTINHGNFSPVPGETIDINILMDTLSATGPNGANQTWDYRSLSGGTNESTVFISPAGTPAASRFLSNLCIHDAPGGDYSYYYVDNNGMKYLGTCDATGSNGNAISNPSNLYKYPMTYNTNYTQVMNETLTDFATSNAQVTTGIKTWAVTGYGTLKLPSGTFNNVLKLVTTTIDTLHYQNNVVATAKIVTTEWLYPGIHSPLLGSAVYVSYNTGSSTPMVNGNAYYTSKTPLAVNQLVKEQYRFTCYPNPAAGATNVKFVPQYSGPAVVNILSLSGQLVASRAAGNVAKDNETVIPVSLEGLAAGNYIVDLDLSGVHIYQQVAKQ